MGSKGPTGFKKRRQEKSGMTSDEEKSKPVVLGQEKNRLTRTSATEPKPQDLTGFIQRKEREKRNGLDKRKGGKKRAS